MADDDGGVSLDSLSLAEHYAAIREHLDAVARVAPRDLDGAGALEMFDATYEFGDRFSAIATRALPVVETDVAWATEARTFANWVSRRVRITHHRAARMTRLGRALRDELPLTAAAVVTGGAQRINVEQAEILTTCAATSAVRRDALLDPANVFGERFLLTEALLWPASKFRNVVKRWAAATDPDADDRGFKEATDREYLDVALTTGGYFFTAFLTTEHGQLLDTALDALIRIPDKNEVRSRAQLRAEALTTMTRMTLDHGLVGSAGGVKPHVSVHVDYLTLLGLAAAAGVVDLLPIPYAPANITGLDALTGTGTRTGAGALTGTGSLTGVGALRSGLLEPAMFEDGQPVPWAVLERILCNGEISRMVFGPDGQILNVGRKKRTYRKHLRRAIIARDKHCQFPACSAPPRLARATTASTGPAITATPMPPPGCSCAGTTTRTSTTTASRSPGNPASAGSSPTATANPSCEAEPGKSGSTIRSGTPADRGTVVERGTVVAGSCRVHHDDVRRCHENGWKSPAIRFSLTFRPRTTTNSSVPHKPTQRGMLNQYGLLSAGILIVVLHAFLSAVGVGKVGQPSDIGGGLLLLAGYLLVAIAVVRLVWRLGRTRLARRNDDQGPRTHGGTQM